jgi:hypothetical protein
MERPHRYILDENRQPVPVDDLLEWAEWLETADRHVAFTSLSGGVEVSTVFLGIDHIWFGASLPILFETAVIRNGQFDIQSRYATWQEAEEAHQRVVADLCKDEGRQIIAEDVLNAEIII